MHPIEKMTALNLELAMHASYEVEKTIRGSIIVWQVPVSAVAYLVGLIEREVTKLNSDTRLQLRMMKMETAPNVFVLTNEQVTDGHTKNVNIRFNLRYTGPDLSGRKHNMHAIPTDKLASLEWLHKALSRSTGAAAQSAPSAANIPQKPIDVSIATHYTRIVGKFVPYNMVFQIQPNKKLYEDIIRNGMVNMTVANIVVTQQSLDRGFLTYHVNAAGRPFLIKVGKAVDEVVRTAIRNLGA